MLSDLVFVALGCGQADVVWEEKTKAGEEVEWPSARYWHAIAYDSARGKVVLFGGNGAALAWATRGSGTARLRL